MLSHNGGPQLGLQMHCAPSGCGVSWWDPLRKDYNYGTWKPARITTQIILLWLLLLHMNARKQCPANHRFLPVVLEVAGHDVLRERLHSSEWLTTWRLVDEEHCEHLGRSPADTVMWDMATDRPLNNIKTMTWNRRVIAAFHNTRLTCLPIDRSFHNTMQWTTNRWTTQWHCSPLNRLGLKHCCTAGCQFEVFTNK